ncbi:MAG TPA: ParB N-terminal domain-containing protein, partial [Spirochaetota bacterium]|nr:ParB N-terminal domain-containing protein [Spirochaetota bacterium]
MEKVNIDPEIREIRLDEVVPAPYNPRKIGDPAKAGLKASIESFGYAELLVVNRRNMRIVGGCQRYEALKSLGIETAEVIMVDLD